MSSDNLIHGFVYSVSTTIEPSNSITLHAKIIKNDNIEDYTYTINNFIPNFYIKKPAFISINDFKDELNELKNRKGIRYNIKEFHDGNWTNATSKQIFYEIYGNYKSLRSAYWELRKYVMENMYLNIDTWTLMDEIDFNNTENPFRYSRFINPSSWQYILSTRHDISICGCNSFKPLRKDVSKSNENQSLKSSLKDNHSIVDFQSNDISNYIKSTHEDFDSFIKVLAYDIETYTPDNMSYEVSEHVIMCIGICFFILSSNIPYRRLCLIIKPVENARDGFIEYSKDDKIETEYVSFTNEEEMLKAYIELIKIENPLIIVGFNNYGFDDAYVYNRMKRYHLEKDFITLFSYDNTAVYKEIDLKIDGIQQSANFTIIGNKIFVIDVYKYMLKANPKLYTQQAKGNLNSMLSLNKIKSPYDNISDVQKTGLTYQQMFTFWKSNINIRDIAYYCMNDAFCAGLLLIKMGLLQDKIKLGETSCSSFYDSLYKEVSEKVLTKIEEFGWKNRFCLSDDTLGIKRPSLKDLYADIENQLIK